MKRLVALSVALAALVSLPSCAHQGPAQIDDVESPPSDILIDPGLVKMVGIPKTRAPVRTLTADGRMQFSFHLQNQTDKQLRLQYTATFYDGAGVAIEPQKPITLFLPPNELKPVPPIAASSKEARNISVQVRPAR